MRTRRGHAYSVLTPPTTTSSSSSSPASSCCVTERPSKRSRICLYSNTSKIPNKKSNSCINGKNPCHATIDPSQLARLHQNHEAAEGEDIVGGSNPFDALPDDLMLSIFVCISSTACAPSDLLATRRTCKKFKSLATEEMVLKRASLSALRVSAERWNESSKRYLQSCADAGNVEACYTLGMIRFYCLMEREQGMKLMTSAAKVLHPCALHSLAVIQFNGSGGARKHKNLRAGVSLCARAAALGHIDAMRELGHCLQDGYGIARNVLEGRKLLLEANAREVAAAVSNGNTGMGYASSIHHPNMAAASANASAAAPNQAQSQKGGGGHPSELAAVQMAATKIAIGCFHHHILCSGGAAGEPKLASEHAHLYHRHPLYKLLQSGGCSLLSDFGCNVPPQKLHPCHAFLVSWFSAPVCPPAPGLRLCSHQHCGRPETRRHEFRRCSACGHVNYCSRACQALDWKLRHKFVCVPAATFQQAQQQNNNRAAQPNPIVNANANANRHHHRAVEGDDVENF